jgi:hypothetical protein
MNSSPSSLLHSWLDGPSSKKRKISHSAAAAANTTTSANVFVGVPAATSTMTKKVQEEMAEGQGGRSYEDDDDDDTTTCMDPFFPARHCIALGWLVGVFIQLSSLGGNVLMINHHHHALMDMTTATSSSGGLGAFGWIWSVLTSTLGVVILCTLRGLLRVHHHRQACGCGGGSSGHNFGRGCRALERSLMRVEVYFAVGALFGVCMAWMGTDLLLGLPHLLHSFLTLVGAVVWFFSMVRCLYNDEDEADDEDDAAAASHCTNSEHSVERGWKEPLLSRFYHEGEDSEDEDGDDVTAVQVGRTKLYSLTMGAGIGLFIQFSSLGANFCLQELNLGLDDSSNLSTMPLSLLWSALTSTMGVVVLLLVRAIYIEIASSSSAGCSSSIGAIAMLLLHMECYFAIGAVVGLNLSWSVTDYLLALDTHYWQSLLTLVATLAWCKVVLYCTHPPHHSSSDETDYVAEGAVV